MSAPAPIRLRTLAFGDLDAGLWGYALAPIDDPGMSVFIGSPGEPGNGAIAELKVGAADGPWALALPDGGLRIASAGDGREIMSSVDGAQATLEICTVQGTVRVNGIDRQVDCLGQRGTRTLHFELSELGSLRDLTAWFGPGDGLALTSVRPRRARDHARDVSATILLEEGSALTVQEPRLSTTYTASGLPARASLELWLEEPPGPDGDEGGAAAQHFPRRAAGERAGGANDVSLAALDVHAELFRWHMRGLEGAGVYALARPR